MEIGVAGIHQVVVELDAGHFLGGFGVFAAQQHHVLQVFQLVLDRRDQRQEGLVDEQDAVLGVVEDIHQLFREQARVDGVAHQAGTGHTEIGFQVAVVVPGQGGDPVALFQAQAQQRRTQLAGPPFHFAPVGAVEAAGGLHGDDLSIGVVAGGVGDLCADQQRLFHHLA